MFAPIIGSFCEMLTAFGAMKRAVTVRLTLLVYLIVSAKRCITRILLADAAVISGLCSTLIAEAAGSTEAFLVFKIAFSAFITDKFLAVTRTMRICTFTFSIADIFFCMHQSDRIKAHAAYRTTCACHRLAGLAFLTDKITDIQTVRTELRMRIAGKAVLFFVPAIRAKETFRAVIFTFDQTVEALMAASAMHFIETQIIRTIPAAVALRAFLFLILPPLTAVWAYTTVIPVINCGYPLRQHTDQHDRA